MAALTVLFQQKSSLYAFASFYCAAAAGCWRTHCVTTPLTSGNFSCRYAGVTRTLQQCGASPGYTNGFDVLGDQPKRSSLNDTKHFFSEDGRLFDFRRYRTEYAAELRDTDAATVVREHREECHKPHPPVTVVAKEVVLSFPNLRAVVGEIAIAGETTVVAPRPLSPNVKMILLPKLSFLEKRIRIARLRELEEVDLNSIVVVDGPVEIKNADVCSIVYSAPPPPPPPGLAAGGGPSCSRPADIVFLVRLARGRCGLRPWRGGETRCGTVVVAHRARQYCCCVHWICYPRISWRLHPLGAVSPALHLLILVHAGCCGCCNH